jgi:hypothetical protein
MLIRIRGYKFGIPEIFFGMMIGAMLFLLGASFESSRYLPSNQSTKTGADNGGGPIVTNQAENKITDWLLVLFNGLLFGSTLLLWRVTKTAADATKKAANAADLSARAVTVVERAYVYPEIISAGAVGECIKEALVFYENDFTKDDTPIPTTAEITFKIKNYGKTPAILKAVYAGFGAHPVGAEIGLSISEAILGVNETTRTLHTPMEVGLTRNQARHILVYTASVGFSGQIIFDDIWGDEHTTRFFFAWDKDIQRMALRGIEIKTKQKGE